MAALSKLLFPSRRLFKIPLGLSRMHFTWFKKVIFENAKSVVFRSLSIYAYNSSYAWREDMKPRGPLMIEHRLIEKVLKLAHNKAQDMNENNYTPILIDTIVDFIKVYADRTHHGKEEDILFIALKKKLLDEEDRKIMRELIDEHKQARAKVGEIVELNEKYTTGNKQVVREIVKCIEWLAAFYPVHIEKEDKVFFPNTEKYFSTHELNDMLDLFWEFDRKMIHEKYHVVYNNLVGLG